MIYLTGFSTYTKLYQLDPLIISKLELFSYIRYVLVFVKCFKNLSISLDSNSGFGTFRKNPHSLNNLRVSTFLAFFNIKKMFCLVCVMRNDQETSLLISTVKISLQGALKVSMSYLSES